MIIFNTVRWKNFLSTGNAGSEVKLDADRSTLVIGKNGEGKSTMLDAICFALFGRAFREINRAQLINTINNKACLVEIEFSTNGRTYKVIRGMKPNIFEIWENGIKLNQDAASRDYQKALEQQILKFSFKTFSQVIALGASSFVPFMRLQSLQRRQVIEDILDIGTFSVMNQILREEMVTVKDQIKECANEIKLAKAQVESKKELLDTITKNSADRLDVIESKLKDNKIRAKAQAEIIEKQEVIVDDLLAQIEGLGELTDLSKTLLSTKTQLETKIAFDQEHIEFFEDHDSCPSCSQDIPEDHKKHIVDGLNSHKADIESNLTVLVDDLTKLNESIEMRRVLQSKITASRSTIAECRSAIKYLESSTQSTIKEKADVLSTNINIDESREDLKNSAKSAMACIEHKRALQMEQAIQNASAELLKDSGIKASIIREYIPLINSLINKYLTAMDAYLLFEIDEEFNEVIRSRYRDTFSYASFSEGEKMRIDLAILLTWRKIAAMKNSVSTNLLVMDEIFDSSLDDAGIDAFLGLMSAIDGDLNVFVISHKGEQLYEKFDKVLKVEKHNDYSVITQI